MPVAPVNPWPEEDQSWTSECWAYAVANVFLHFGMTLGKPNLQAAFGGAIAAAVHPENPNRPVYFSDVQTAIDDAARMYGGTIERWTGNGNNGYVYDVDDIPGLADDGWGVIVCAYEGLILSGQNYGHFFVVRDESGTVVHTVDSFHHESGASETLDWPTVRNAIASWDGSGPKAIAFKVA